MALADTLKPILYSVRAITGQFGLRPYSVAIVQTTYSGAHTGRGTSSGTPVAITEGNGQPPKVRQLNTEELALGNLGKGSLRIGPITPGHPGGGTAIEVLKPCLAAGQTVHVIVTGPEYSNGAKFAIKDLETDHALHYMLTVEPVSEMGQ